MCNLGNAHVTGGMNGGLGYLGNDHVVNDAVDADHGVDYDVDDAVGGLGDAAADDGVGDDDDAGNGINALNGCDVDENNAGGHNDDDDLGDLGDDHVGHVDADDGDVDYNVGAYVDGNLDGNCDC